jgi:hypothetical protein
LPVHHKSQKQDNAVPGLESANIDFSATVSARAMTAEGNSTDGFFHQDGDEAPSHWNVLVAGFG